MIEKVEQLFDDLYFELNENTIREFYRSNPTSQGLSLMFKGFCNYCYFAFTNSDTIENVTSIKICYIQYKQALKAYGVEIPILSEFSNELSFKLACHLNHIDSDLELIETYNQLQYHRTVALEDCDYFVINSAIDKNKGTLLSFDHRGIVDVWTYSRRKFYSNVMFPIVDKPHQYPDNKIYLMLDDKTGYFKIGRSKNPIVREKTLQSEKPEIFLIAQWSAPKIIEKELQHKYRSKNIRGEWFRLSVSDLDDIRDFMNSLEF